MERGDWITVLFILAVLLIAMFIVLPKRWLPAGTGGGAGSSSRRIRACRHR
jgi:hypothetical protein